MVEGKMIYTVRPKTRHAELAWDYLSGDIPISTLRRRLEEVWKWVATYENGETKSIKCESVDRAMASLDAAILEGRRRKAARKRA